MEKEMIEGYLSLVTSDDNFIVTSDDEIIVVYGTYEKPIDPPNPPEPIDPVEPVTPSTISNGIIFVW